MEFFDADVAIVGAGGAGLRAAIAIAQYDPALTVALVSKVYPMRSHTVAAEGGAAGVVQAHDSLDAHFHDTVAGGDWLCDQDVVEYFVSRCTPELLQMEHWGCPWSRRPDGRVDVRAFGGMKIERTWFAADRTGMHMLHTLFQTSLQFRSIRRFDEHFCADLLVDGGNVRGVLTIAIASGEFVAIRAPSVIVATGGAGRVFRENTNGGIVTGDGMALAYLRGVPLRDMEFVQYHPTCMPGTGILFTEACRGEGGWLLNRDGYRYLQDYGLGPPSDTPRNKFMELGPRDWLSQAFWREERAGRTIDGPHGAVVHLDLRHLGTAKLRERLPQICDLAKEFLGIDPANSPIPVRPAVHYTMGGILVDGRCATSVAGLYAAGECSSVGIHGANRLGSNSLSELCVFGRLAGEEAARHAREAGASDAPNFGEQAREAADRCLEPLARRSDGERMAGVRREMADTMERGCGIFRQEEALAATCAKLDDLTDRSRAIRLDDRSRTFNTEWLLSLELGYQLEVAKAMAHSARARLESRGAHQRLDGYTSRDDARFLRHTVATWAGPSAPPRISHADVRITRSPPAVRAYGAAGETAATGRST